jgi:hypothetical protein
VGGVVLCLAGVLGGQDLRDCRALSCFGSSVEGDEEEDGEEVGVGNGDGGEGEGENFAAAGSGGGEEESEEEWWCWCHFRGWFWEMK